MSPDVVVVGAGPNGLAAAITLAATGRSVEVYEAGPRPGGAVASANLTLEGFVHDVGAAVFPFVGSTGYFSRIPLEKHGLRLVFPEASVAHPLDDGSAVILWRDLDRTCLELGKDGARYRTLVGPVVESWEGLSREILAPPHVPAHPVLLARFVARAAPGAARLASLVFSTRGARAAFGGLASHGIVPLSHPLSSAFALVMAVTCHHRGWPVVEGGSGRLADALVSHLEHLGGRILTSREVRDIRELGQAGAVFFDLWPAHAVKIAGGRVSGRYRSAAVRYRPGPGVFKVDWALAGPIPWKASGCDRAATVHVCGTLEEIARAEREVWEGTCPQRPFVFLVQPTLFDVSRVPAGRHTAWAYCHVPTGSPIDMTERIERQIERFAPGFRDLVLARSTMGPADIEAFDANCVGGDISGGAHTLRQVFARPVFSFNPYVMGEGPLYLCSAATPPGGGVHGMCGHLAAMAYLDAMPKAARDT